jgi:hypothetical protein
MSDALQTADAHSWQEREGYDALWLWFGLSRASWLTLPRVLMHEMPDQWQADMARLLSEFNETFPNMQPATTIVTATENKRLVKMPEGAGNYRRPCHAYIQSALPPLPEPTP